MKTGNFGKVKDAYVSARQAFTIEAIKYIWQHIDIPAPNILDLGCGTGLATRQLAEYKKGDITGIDIDQQMIKAAKETMFPNVKYIVSGANNLPFSDNEFDVVTSFSAFHWFKDKKSITEIKRVIKNDGWFFVINKNDTSGFRKGYKEKLERLLDRELPRPKDKYNPAIILKEAGFKAITGKLFTDEEKFTLKNALLHIKSSASWALVPEEKKKQAIKLMEEHIRETMTDGYAVRKTEVIVVVGKKYV